MQHKDSEVKPQINKVLLCGSCGKKDWHATDGNFWMGLW